MQTEDKLPPIELYREYLRDASKKFNLTIDECRDKYGQFTIRQWTELLNPKTDNTTQLPLYKVLDGNRIQGEMKIESHPVGEYLQFDDIDFAQLCRPKTKQISVSLTGNERDEKEAFNAQLEYYYKCSAEYTALAVNNLVSLAEALNDMVKEFDSYAVPVTKYPEVKATIKKAKEALQRIS